MAQVQRGGGGGGEVGGELGRSEGDWNANEERSRVGGEQATKNWASEEGESWPSD